MFGGAKVILSTDSLSVWDTVKGAGLGDAQKGIFISGLCADAVRHLRAVPLTQR